MNYRDYIKALDNFDWVYYMTTCSKTYAKGKAEQDRLLSIANSDPIADRIYKGYIENLNARMEGTIPIPERPTIEDVKDWLLDQKIAA